MIDYTDCTIETVSVHQVGNKTNDEELHLSKAPLELSDIKIRELLIHFFLKPFPEPEFYNFTFSNGDFNLNPLFNFAKTLFEDPGSFQINSIHMAKQLYEISNHPNIKSGDLFIAKFSDLRMDDEITDAIGIFKSENRQDFLKLDNQLDDFILNYEDGINIDKLDKGCLIFNTEQSEGFKVCIIDKSNKSIEAQYWRDLFLNLKPCSDNFHSTKEFLNLTKQYVTKQVSEEFDIPKADKIDLLNRSVEYFKSHEEFDQEEFENNVFHEEALKESFQNFNKIYREEENVELSNHFEISPQAVKKQARVFKSVLKLDKNFHIYIHGKRELIEQGVEMDGRKYYKIYYDKEV